MSDEDLNTTHKAMPMGDGRTIHYYRNTEGHPPLPLAQVITGGLGYIGQSLAFRLKSEQQTVVVIDNRSIASQVPGLAVVRGSVGDAEVWEWIRARYQIEVVYHCAGLISVSESVTEPSRYFQHNVIEGTRMLDHLRQAPPVPLIFSSSAAVYGTPLSVPIAESSAKAPLSAYGVTKLQFEQILDAYAKAYQMPWVALRYFNAAGYLGMVREHHQPETHVLPLMAKAIRAQESPLVFGTDYDTPDGSAIRDYIHISDLVDAHLKAAKYLQDGGAPIALNLGSGTGASVLELVAAFARVSGRSVTPRLVDRRAGDPPQLVAGIEAAKRILGWEPQHSTVDSVVQDAWNASEEEDPTNA
ncbi:MAG: UDP-glucose 4-epimerase GalE [Firmicutes bacterium]|jgi:UDP-glucose 4-epimerase|nr:UDP-glucose 4-epimerase GalE [Bacillota bacterium]